MLLASDDTYVEVVKVLVAAGADVNAKNKVGSWWWATCRLNDGAADVLVEIEPMIFTHQPQV